MKVTRAVAGTAIAAALLLTLNPTSAVAAADTGLRDAAKHTGVRIGTAVDMAAFNADTTYRDAINREFNSVVAENVMKWGEIEKERGVLNFAAADQLVDSARANGQQVRGHTLLWHNQLPGWLTAGVTSGEIDAAELRQILKRHVFEVAGHFRGRIVAWDVVNEIIDDNAQLRDTIFLRLLGPGYIADMFRWAHQADPKAKLYLNDYNVEGINAKSTAYYDLVKQLKADRVPVHGFGIQGHLGVQYPFPNNVLDNVRRFEKLGLDTAFTEVDVRMPMPPDATKLQAQAYAYSALLQACLLAQRCVSFTVWGFTDKYSWVPGVFNGQGAANLLDENFIPKLAYDAVKTTFTLGGR
ncbi:endo-1,4-beta-xylanase [Phytohabitans aurantiacus]|jgi:endo-1,4-beta-xylanase|uniref:endo-1,4-beta-xylanase n=1 Tax=Phytohabitans aurantiacus TaxID=3016789 RepID=UPI002493B201|nr:endo-1,4-beta-xylanase [Phytohabitans aurantiacus]